MSTRDSRPEIEIGAVADLKFIVTAPAGDGSAGWGEQESCRQAHGYGEDYGCGSSLTRSSRPRRREQRGRRSLTAHDVRWKLNTRRITGVAPRTRALRRVRCGGPATRNQPTHSAEDQVNAEEEPDDPDPVTGQPERMTKPAMTPTCRRAEQPARFRAWRKIREKFGTRPPPAAKRIPRTGSEERAGERLAKQDSARGDVEKPEQEKCAR